MRYATSETTPISVQSTEQMMFPEYAASNIDYSHSLIKPYKYVSWPHNHYDNHKYDNFHRGKLLDHEDKSLLEKFYKETKENDPFNSVWTDEEEMRSNNQLNALLDNNDDDDDIINVSKDLKNVDNFDPAKELKKVELNHNNDWTIDPDYNNDFNFDHLQDNPENVHFAKYSPTLKLLTSYNPIEVSLSDNHSKIVGATLFGNDQNSSPNVSSKSANDAVRMHDDLLRDPPKDGNVRVRMYYHRAIHDDAKLYGNGPWKYWGHGWGLEFGFNPKNMVKDKDNFYQKGYTIERAFGRDFCKDKKNCRQSDPKFFEDPLNIGKYTSERHNFENKQPINDGLSTLSR